MSAPYLQDNARSAYLARSRGKAAGCASTSVPGAMAPLTDHPPEAKLATGLPRRPTSASLVPGGAQTSDGLATWDTTRTSLSDTAMSG